MKLTKKQQVEIIEARLVLSMLRFHSNLPWIIRKLFSKQALDWYEKGKDDALADYNWLKAKLKRMEKIK
jgi:hypothetical protein